MIEVEGLYKSDYLSKPKPLAPHRQKADSWVSLTENTVPLIAWSAAEIAITLICIGNPVLRPLYKRVYQQFRTQSTRSTGYLKQSDRSRDQPGYALHTIGGGLIDAGQSDLKRGNGTQAIRALG